MSFVFEEAKREQRFLKMSIAGPSGSGKTWTALTIGSRIAELTGGKLAVIDTENGSASLYAGYFNFLRANLGEPFSPERYIEAIKAAQKAGITVLVIDSISHEWSGPGGVLEEVNKIAAAKFRGNTWSAWSVVTPRHDAFKQAIIDANMHIIVTMRSKQETVQVEEGGRKTVKKLGMGAIQRDGTEYEYDLHGDIDIDHAMILSKTRFPGLDGKIYQKPNAELADAIWNYLTEGAGAPQPQEAFMTPEEPQIVATEPPAQPQAQNGNGKAPEAEKDPAKLTNEQMESKQKVLSRVIHSLGVNLYGDKWNDNRHRLVKDMTKGRTESSSEMTIEEMEMLVESLEVTARVSVKDIMKSMGWDENDPNVQKGIAKYTSSKNSNGVRAVKDAKGVALSHLLKAMIEAKAKADEKAKVEEAVAA